MPHKETTLIVLGGPSGSGKSSVARLVRAAWESPMALVEQDYLRRIVLKEKEIAGGTNIELIRQTVLFALTHSFDVILEGILDAGRYTEMLEELIKIHPKNNHFFYFDISLDETLRRHQTKPNKDEFGETEMRKWYKSNDLLQFTNETIIPETSSQREIIDVILSTSWLK